MNEITMLCNSYEMAVSLKGYLSENGVDGVIVPGEKKNEFYLTAMVPTRILGGLQLRFNAYEKANQAGNAIGSLLKCAGGVTKAAGTTALGLTVEGAKATTETAISLFGSAMRGLTAVGNVAATAVRKESAAFKADPNWQGLKSGLNMDEGSETFIVKKS